MLQLDPFYPIVPESSWLARLLPQGVKLVQLRIKDQPPNVVRTEIDRAIQLCADHDCQLVVNDYWREAIEAGADFVHLGQGDLVGADLAAVKTAGMRIGVSTHSPKELDVALAAEPAYVALGPIYPTLLKRMPWPPQGLERLAEWKKRISCPLVAIGGITPERAPRVLEAGADSVAVITDIMTNQHPELQTGTWIAVTQPWRHYQQGIHTPEV